jgi:hypothetical protein
MAVPKTDTVIPKIPLSPFRMADSEQPPRRSDKVAFDQVAAVHFPGLFRLAGDGC